MAKDRRQKKSGKRKSKKQPGIKATNVNQNTLRVSIIGDTTTTSKGLRAAFNPVVNRPYPFVPNTIITSGGGGYPPFPYQQTNFENSLKDLRSSFMKELADVKEYLSELNLPQTPLDEAQSQFEQEMSELSASSGVASSAQSNNGGLGPLDGSLPGSSVSDDSSSVRQPPASSSSSSSTPPPPPPRVVPPSNPRRQEARARRPNSLNELTDSSATFAPPPNAYQRTQ